MAASSPDAGGNTPRHPSSGAISREISPATPATAGHDVAAEPLGPPPPYRPIPPAPAMARPAVGMAPASPPGRVAVHLLDAIGPPPPYRPVVRVAAVFERGPAPDLEPWRLATHAPVRVPRPDLEFPPDEAEPDWTLPRPPEMAPAAEPKLDRATRLEATDGIGPRDLPVLWPAASTVVPGGPPGAQGFVVVVGGKPVRGRAAGRLLWAAGTLTMLVVIALGLHLGQRRVVRMFPAAGPIYTALGLSGGPSVAPPTGHANGPGATPTVDEGPGAATPTVDKGPGADTPTVDKGPGAATPTEDEGPGAAIPSGDEGSGTATATATGDPTAPAIRTTCGLPPSDDQPIGDQAGCGGGKADIDVK